MEGASSHRGHPNLLPPPACLGPHKACSPLSMDPKHLTVLYYNAGSLLPKMDELQANVLSQKPNIICIVETWLSEDISDNELSVMDYQLQRLDRNRYGGGILLCVHNSLSYKVLLKGGPFNLKFLALIVTTKSADIPCNKVCICLFYRPPSSPVSIFDNLCTTVQIVNLAQFSIFLLIGDFNVNFLNPHHHLFFHMSVISCTAFLCHKSFRPLHTRAQMVANPSLIWLYCLMHPVLSLV